MRATGDARTDGLIVFFSSCCSGLSATCGFAFADAGLSLKFSSAGAVVARRRARLASPRGAAQHALIILSAYLPTYLPFHRAIGLALTS